MKRRLQGWDGRWWRNQAAANYLGPSRALPADCFSCGWIFGSARCGWERVATLRA